jgi:hypothetical protein
MPLHFLHALGRPYPERTVAQARLIVPVRLDLRGNPIPPVDRVNMVLGSKPGDLFEQIQVAVPPQKPPGSQRRGTRKSLLERHSAHVPEQDRVRLVAPLTAPLDPESSRDRHGYLTINIIILIIHYCAFVCIIKYSCSFN